MKYLLFILVAMVLYLGVQKQIDSKRIDNLQKTLTLTQSENKAYRKEIEVYNEKSMETSKEIRELKLKAEQGKKTNPDAYNCFDVIIPTELLN